MARWLVVPKHHDGTLQPLLMQVVEAPTAEDAAANFYMHASVLGPVWDFPTDAPRDKTNARLA